MKLETVVNSATTSTNGAKKVIVKNSKPKNNVVAGPTDESTEENM